MTTRSLTLCLCAAFGLLALQLAGAGGLAQAQSTYQWPDFQPDLQPGPSNSDVKAKPPTVTLSPPTVGTPPAERVKFSGYWQGWMCRDRIVGRQRIGDEGNGQRSEGEICSRKRARENATATGELHTICPFRRRRASTASRAEDRDHSRHARGWLHEHQMGLAAERMVHGHHATHAGTAPGRCLDKREGTHRRQAGSLTRHAPRSARSQVPRQFAGCKSRNLSVSRSVRHYVNSASSVLPPRNPADRPGSRSTMRMIGAPQCPASRFARANGQAVHSSHVLSRRSGLSRASGTDR